MPVEQLRTSNACPYSGIEGICLGLTATGRPYGIHYHLSPVTCHLSLFSCPFSLIPSPTLILNP